MLLEAARELGVRRFLHASTDEVVQVTRPTSAFSEATPLAPSSPGGGAPRRALRHAYFCHGPALGRSRPFDG